MQGSKCLHDAASPPPTRLVDPSPRSTKFIIFYRYHFSNHQSSFWGDPAALDAKQTRCPPRGLPEQAAVALSSLEPFYLDAATRILSLSAYWKDLRGTGSAILGPCVVRRHDISRTATPRYKAIVERVQGVKRPGT